MTQKWQDIGTCPKDVPVLVTDGTVIVSASISLHPFFWLDPVGFGGYEWDWDFDTKEITHWMPLPPLPDKTK